MAGWSSGWVEIPNVGSPQVRNFSFTHNLGTSDLVFSVYWYTTFPSNTDPISVESVFVTDNGYSKGSRIKILNDNDITLSLMKDGFSGGDWRTGVGAPAYIKVVAISAVADPTPTTPVPGTGDLCKLLPNGDGYQMFRNGLTIQWKNIGPFTNEQEYSETFLIPFSSAPFHISIEEVNVASTKQSANATLQVLSADKDGFSLFAQQQDNWPSSAPLRGLMLAIGIAEVTDCPPASGEADDVDGIKVSELTSASDLKDEDLFLISRDDETDGIYDISKNLKLSDLSQFIVNKVPPPTELKKDHLPSVLTQDQVLGGRVGEYKFWHDDEWMRPTFLRVDKDTVTGKIYEVYYFHRNQERYTYYDRANRTMHNGNGYTQHSNITLLDGSDVSDPVSLSTDVSFVGNLINWYDFEARQVSNSRSLDPGTMDKLL